MWCGWLWLLQIRGAFNKLPDFMYRHLKLSKTLQYVIAIHLMRWLINLVTYQFFMISGPNEKLLQQLKYSLLKPDCHSWCISKMQSGREDTLEERYAIKFCFKLGKNATKRYGMLQTTFVTPCMNLASVFWWHKRFKEGRESARDDERPCYLWLLVIP